MPTPKSVPESPSVLAVPAPVVAHPEPATQEPQAASTNPKSAPPPPAVARQEPAPPVPSPTPIREAPQNVAPKPKPRSKPPTITQQAKPSGRHRKRLQPVSKAVTPKKRKLEKGDKVAQQLTCVRPLRSPVKMANGACKEKCCHHHPKDHEGSTLNEEWDTSFTPLRLSWENYPASCSLCHRDLKKAGAKGFQKAIHTQVSPNKPCWACKNAINHRDHKCLYCECYECWTRAQADAPRGRRARKQASQLQPGEVLLADGTVTSKI